MQEVYFWLGVAIAATVSGVLITYIIRYNILQRKHRLLIGATRKIRDFLFFHRQVFDMLETRDAYYQLLQSLNDFLEEDLKENYEDHAKRKRIPPIDENLRGRANRGEKTLISIARAPTFEAPRPAESRED